MNNQELYKLNPVFRIVLNDPITIELPLSGDCFECDDFALIQAVSFLTNSFSFQDATNRISTEMSISQEKAESILTELSNIGLIIKNDYTPENLDSALHWHKRGWGDAFYLHNFSRDLNYEDDIEHTKNTDMASIRKTICTEMAQELPSIWEEPEHQKAILLPPPAELPKDRDIEQILLDRRSNQLWTKRDLTEQELSNILGYGNKETLYCRLQIEKNIESDPESLLNFSSFSALESRIMVLRPIGKIEPGVYHYDIKNHRLLLLKKGLFAEDLVQMCIGQKQLKNATFSIILTAYWKKYFHRYQHPRAYRNLLINAGEIAQKYLLLATIHNLSQFITPAFEDKKADSLIGTNGYENAPIYSLSFG